MARTAPAPDIPPIPGMCPSIAVLGGGGDGGGGSGKGAGQGGGKTGAGTGSGGENAAGDQKNAASGSGKGGSGCPCCPLCHAATSAGDPVDVVTGRVFTDPVMDLWLTGPLQLHWTRSYNSANHDRDIGLGHGWTYGLSWEVEVFRRSARLFKDDGTMVEFEIPKMGEVALGRDGWALRHQDNGFVADAGNDVFYVFGKQPGHETRYLLTAIEDNNKNRISLRYEQGRLVEITDSVGRVVRVLWHRECRIASLEVLNAPVRGQSTTAVQYLYDEFGDLVAVKDAAGFATRFAYEDHLLVESTDPSGVTANFIYDEQHRCIETWCDAPPNNSSLAASVSPMLADHKTKAKGLLHCKFDYHPDGYSEVMDSVQLQRFFGNEHGKVDKMLVGGSATTRTYDVHGHEICHIDALGAVTTWQRDDRGRVLKQTDPLGRVVSIQRDASGRMTELVDPAGGIFQIFRDSRGNMTTIKDQAEAVSSFKYNDRGQVIEATSPNGGRSTATYDDQGNMVRLVDPNGAVWQATYDALGRRTSIKNPLGAITQFSYDSRGELVAVHGRGGGTTRYNYDGYGHLTQIVSPDGGVIELGWGGYHRLCWIKKPDGQTYSLKYDREGRLIELHNERGEVHRYRYNSAGTLIEEHTFDGRKLFYEVDALGQIIRFTSGSGQKTEFEFDLAGQLIQRVFGDDAPETFEYDLRGNLVAAENAAGRVSFERDAIGRIVRELQQVGDAVFSIDTAYDVLGKKARRATSRGHIEQSYRNIMGHRERLILDEKLEIKSVYDLLGQEVERHLPGGSVIESAFDAVGRLTRRRVVSKGMHRGPGRGEPDWVGPRASSAILDKAYRYSPGGEQIETWDQARGAIRYEVDPLGRLVAAVQEGGAAELFRYDAAGNLFDAGLQAKKRVYGPGNQLLECGDYQYIWDQDSHLIRKQKQGEQTGWEYTWLASGHLASVTTPDGTIVEFAYDAFARRIEKRVSKPLQTDGPLVMQARTRYVWDGNTLVHEIRETMSQANDAVIEERTYCFADGTHLPVAHEDAVYHGTQKITADWVYYVNDPVGTPEALIQADGQLRCELLRSAFGKTEIKSSLHGSNKTLTPLRFQGQYEDPETGLVYNRFRYYDPETGRYISADPLEIRGGLNAFSYGLNPLRWVDPLGLAFGIPTLTPPADPKGNVGSMNGQAVKHLVDAKAAGASADELADMYDGMKQQIETEAKNRGQDWTASRGRCADGSHAFMGSKGPCLVITPDRQIATGTALGGPSNLIDTSRPSFSRDGSGKPVITFPAPNMDAAGKKF